LGSVNCWIPTTLGMMCDYTMLSAVIKFKILKQVGALSHALSVSLKPRHGQSSGCGWRRRPPDTDGGSRRRPTISDPPTQDVGRVGVTFRSMKLTLLYFTYDLELGQIFWKILSNEK
jgi:hypothetical protein